MIYCAQDYLSLSVKKLQLCQGLPFYGFALLFSLVLLVTVGCNSKPDLKPVTGLITIDGEPVTTGRIEFFPKSGRPAGGDIGNFGRYQLTTYSEHDGVLAGSYAVTITAMRPKDEEPQFKNFAEEMEYGAKVAAGEIEPEMKRPRTKSNVEWIVPQKYANRSTSGLTAEVTEDGKEINFELKSDH